MLTFYCWNRSGLKIRSGYYTVGPSIIVVDPSEKVPGHGPGCASLRHGNKTPFRVRSHKNFEESTKNTCLFRLLTNTPRPKLGSEDRLTHWRDTEPK